MADEVALLLPPLDAAHADQVTCLADGVAVVVDSQPLFVDLEAIKHFGENAELIWMERAVRDADAGNVVARFEITASAEESRVFVGLISAQLARIRSIRGESYL